MVRNVLIVAITRLGDLLQASPTIAGIKEENPGCRITVLVDKQFADVCRGIPGIDEIRETDLGMLVRCMGRDGDSIIDAYQFVDNLVTSLRAEQYDFCINMASSGYTAILLKLLNIKASRGWIADDEGYRLINNPWSVLFAAFVFHSNRDYNSINLVDIIRCSAGVRAHPKQLLYTVPVEAKSFPEQFLQSSGIGGSGPVICIQAGASQEKRQWAARKFAELATHLIDSLDARLVFTGSKQEAPLIDEICTLAKHQNIRSVAGSTNLGQLAALLERADLLITGDTGPMHLAVAVGTPVVALFLASALCFETGPYSVGNIVVQPQISCNPCNPNYPCAKPDCHNQVTPELIAYLAELRLREPLSKLNLEIPSSLANPRQVTVYISAFDKDDFLEFRPLNGSGYHHGERTSIIDQARAAYRQLWKEEFAGIPAPSSNGNGHRTETPSRLPVLDGKKETFSEMTIALSQAQKYSEEGRKLIDQLMGLIEDTKSPPQFLGQISTAINGLDRNIEELGLSCPILGALTRVFVMEKNNMRGDDPLLLASEMKELYQRLERRGRKFQEFMTVENQHS